MDKMREEFEEWGADLFDYYDWTDRLEDGAYSCPHIEMYWSIWKASRDWLIIELPEPKGSVSSYAKAVHSALEDVGVEWTE